MNCPIQIDTIRAGSSIIFIKGSHVSISHYVFLSMKIVIPLMKCLMRSSLFVKVPIKGFPVF